MAIVALCKRGGTQIIKSIPSSSVSRSFSSRLFRGVRPVAALTEFTNRFPLTPIFGASTLKCMSTDSASSLNDVPRGPPTPTFCDGCDFEHWFVVMERPQGEPSRDEIIDTYINTVAKVVGRMKIYSVSTRHYFAFGARVSEELAYKFKDLPGVRWVVPDSYLDVRSKSYRGEPFINGKAVPYDPKYHEEWVRNEIRASEITRQLNPSRDSKIREIMERQRNFQANKPGSPPKGMVSYPSTQNPGDRPPNRNMDNPGQNMGGARPNKGDILIQEVCNIRHMYRKHWRCAATKCMQTWEVSAPNAGYCND
ncbi:hypothetical protein MKW94_026501 [Papaver nudicaule]|uniref:MORF/ORRM1/DAG-like MORF domain-containing protein n=1 Tax=Papaver nudicaule TaxID=74823 RepID=A0AA41VI67_PAPNU|nr:hypothetical protein [Papaver nudicaule]